LSSRSGVTSVVLPAPKLTLPVCEPSLLRAFRKIEPLAWIAVLADTRPFWFTASAASVTLPRSALISPVFWIRLVMFMSEPPGSASISTTKPRSVRSFSSVLSAR
jgi:hypothetical protein